MNEIIQFLQDESITAKKMGGKGRRWAYYWHYQVWTSGSWSWSIKSMENNDSKKEYTGRNLENKSYYQNTLKLIGIWSQISWIRKE